MLKGKTVYLSTRKNTDDVDVAEYEKPTEIVLRPNYFSITPAVSRGALEFLKHGESVYDTWVATANARIFGNKIHAGDLMWIDGESPILELEEKYGNGATATAEVVKAVEVGYTLNIVLRTNEKQIKR